MAGDDAARLPLPRRLRAFFAFALVLLVLVFVPQFNIVVGGSARWLKLGPLPASTRPRSPSSR
jgi:cell division protein FtsW (lipid II flippase)